MAVEVGARRVRELAFRVLFQLDAMAWPGDAAAALASAEAMLEDPELLRLRNSLLESTEDPHSPRDLSAVADGSAAEADDDDGAGASELTAKNTGEANRAVNEAIAAWSSRRRADAAFRELAPTWPAHRQPAADRALLRLGWYELHEAKVKPSIVVNEIVELAKRYSTERSPAFVNALLDKSIRSEAAPSRADDALSPTGGDDDVFIVPELGPELGPKPGDDPERAGDASADEAVDPRSDEGW